LAVVLALLEWLEVLAARQRLALDRFVLAAAMAAMVVQVVVRLLAGRAGAAVVVLEARSDRAASGRTETQTAMGELAAMVVRASFLAAMVVQAMALVLALSFLAEPQAGAVVVGQVREVMDSLEAQVLYFLRGDR
jgi:hypothetical protein